MALAIAVFARIICLDIGLIVSFYIADSYFLLNRRLTILIAIITRFAWTASEYFAQANRFELSPSNTRDARSHLSRTLVTTKLAVSHLFFDSSMYW